MHTSYDITKCLAYWGILGFIVYMFMKLASIPSGNPELNLVFLCLAVLTFIGGSLVFFLGDALFGAFKK